MKSVTRMGEVESEQNARDVQWGVRFGRQRLRPLRRLLGEPTMPSMLCKISQAAAAVLALVLFSGCGPEEFVLWSPDGQYAYVKSERAMLVDSEGRLLGPALGDHEAIAGWMPDSRRIIVVRAVEPKSWEEYAELLGPERTALIALVAEQLAGLIAKYHGDWTKFGADPAVEAWGEFAVLFRGEDVANVAYYLEQKRPGLLAPLLEAATRVAEEKREDTTGLFFEKAPEIPHLSELHLREA